jgi:UDP-N-acetyl-D-mannosaminuronic acid dehydrogenase
MRVAVIGLGVVGNEVLKEVSKKIENVIGIDLDETKVNNLKTQKYKVTTRLTGAFDVYVVCVYSNEQVLELIKKIDYSKKPLVCIESTVLPHSISEFEDVVVKKNNANLVLCPHRFNEGDEDHHVFNLKRLIAGATEECVKRGESFYLNFMRREDLIPTTLPYAALSKLVENSYRFVEIAIAQELKLLCDEKKLSFDELRKCTNTKWNIDLKSARAGIGGKCLPKDVKLINEFFRNNSFFRNAIKADEEYKKKCRIKKS